MCNNIIYADVINKHVVDFFTNYFNAINAIAVEFDQIDANHNRASGILILDKSKRSFLFNYYEPFPLKIVGSSRNVSIYNYSTEELIRLGLEYNFLINQKNKSGIQLMKIIKANEEANHYVLVFFSHLLDKQITIYFSKVQNQISKMITQGADGFVTILPTKIYAISDIENEIFFIRNPKHHGIPLRMNKDEIQLKYKKKS